MNFGHKHKPPHKRRDIFGESIRDTAIQKDRVNGQRYEELKKYFSFKQCKEEK